MRCTSTPIPSRLRGFLIGKIIAVMPLVAAWAAAFGMLETRAQTFVPREYQLKAVFLFNFAQFVEWPPTAFPEAGAPIYIGVLGDDPFGPILEQVVRGETIHHRRLVIKRSRQLEDLKACHLLFISRSEEGQLAQILAGVAGASILTVGETEQFAHRGGVINFTLQENKIRFEINLHAAERAGLKISSKLLQLATVVGSGRGKGGN